MTRVSEFYRLGRTQPALDFVDVDVRDDVKVFLDPRAFRLLQSNRKVSTWVGQFAWSFVESGGGLIQAGPGSGAGWGRWRTKRSGWAV